ncbi:MAG: DivIVA domain-containing protein [Moorellales bacterium]
MLTPLEIQNKEFGRGWRGYRPAEVRAFLEQVLKGYEELYRENRELREQVLGLEQALKKYQEWEQTLKETLVLAQRAAEETRRNAEKEGELIRQEAQRQAEEVLARARAEVEKLRQEYEQLRQQAAAFRRQWRARLQAELEALAAAEEVPGGGASDGSGPAAGE